MLTEANQLSDDLTFIAQMSLVMRTGKPLVQLRERAALSQESAAELAGISLRRLELAEAGAVELTIWEESMFRCKLMARIVSQ